LVDGSLRRSYGSVSAMEPQERASLGIRNVNVFLRATALLALMALAGCGSPPIVSTSAVAVTDAQHLPPPSDTDQIAGLRPSLIGPQDKLQIDVWGVPDLSRVVQVDSGGSISVPLAGRLDVAGKEPDDVAEMLRSRLVRYVKNPVVSVNLQEALSRTLTVDGQVKEPGNYPVMNNMTLIRAIAAAKGADELAKSDEVVIFRTVSGKHMAAVYDLGAIRRGVYEDPLVYANDTIVVGESAKRRMLQYAVQIGPALVTPLIYVLTAL